MESKVTFHLPQMDHRVVPCHSSAPVLSHLLVIEGGGGVYPTTFLFNYYHLLY